MRAHSNILLDMLLAKTSTAAPDVLFLALDTEGSALVDANRDARLSVGVALRQDLRLESSSLFRTRYEALIRGFMWTVHPSLEVVLRHDEGIRFYGINGVVVGDDQVTVRCDARLRVSIRVGAKPEMSVEPAPDWGAVPYIRGPFGESFKLAPRPLSDAGPN